MSLIGDIKDALRQSPATSDGSERSKGAYWCHDCGERIRDVEFEGDGVPSCSVCGDEMEFERSPDSAGCAC
ncbi:hypothetical protein [Haloferax sp. DFSO60]|uniref:hypothetical protein n=1 Tax=Haloferax sp. DFSO60 TaxID=3388652 RepID=UPI00397AD739